MKKFFSLQMIIIFTLVLLVAGCTRTASKTPIAAGNEAEAVPVEMPTKTFVVPKVVISTPSLEIEATPTMKLFVPTAAKEDEHTKPVEESEITIEPEMLTTEVAGEFPVIEMEAGALETPVGNSTPMKQLTSTLSVQGLKATPTASMPTNIPYPVLYGNPGLPTISILSIVQDTSVALQISEFPINKSYTVHIGPYSPSCYDTGNDSSLGTFDSGKNANFTSTYKIPPTLQGYSPLTIRMKIGDGAPFCFFFYNASY